MLPAMNILTSLDALRALYDPVRERSSKKEIPQLDAHARRFIGLSPFLVIGSGDALHGMDTSPRGGAPGFVHAPDARTLLIPDAPGNNRLDTLENIVRGGEEGAPVGLLFLIPGVDETLPEMMRDQIREFRCEEVAAETQEQMLVRYRQTL
jgi:predicted pyridoxine 5'-phosphate oxidase superfamily flavin-nucleotide-binding protein